MKNITLTPLSVEVVKGLGFEKIKQGTYSNGKFELQYSDYGIAYTERCGVALAVYMAETLEQLCSVDDIQLKAILDEMNVVP